MLEPTFGVPALRPPVSGPALLVAVVLKAAVDAPARPDGAAVPDAAAYGVYPLIILIVYVLVTGDILCSRLSGLSLLLTRVPTWHQREPLAWCRQTHLAGFLLGWWVGH